MTRPRILSSGVAAPWTPAWPAVLPHLLLQARPWPHKCGRQRPSTTRSRKGRIRFFPIDISATSPQEAALATSHLLFLRTSACWREGEEAEFLRHGY